jgi:hypothetical protein
MSTDKSIMELFEINEHYKFLLNFKGLESIKDENGFDEFGEDKLDTLEFLFYKYCNKNVSDETQVLIEKLKENIEVLFHRINLEAKQKITA